jgi:hypothetical protein
VAVYNAAKFGLEYSDAWDAEKTLDSVVGVSSDTGQCATSMRNARKVSGGAELPLLSDLSKVPGQAKAFKANAKLLDVAFRALKPGACLLLKAKRVQCRP